MNTFIIPDSEYLPNEEMSANTPMITTILFTVFFGGMYVYDMYKKYKDSEEHVKQIENNVDEMALQQAAHADILTEHEHRIREKQNYDETEEIEDGKYQAWIGSHVHPQVTIMIWRQKISTIKKNQEWVSWNGQEDASTVVRDFYLGNSSPDFEWTVKEEAVGQDECVEASVEDTMVNGWDSLIKLQIKMRMYASETPCDYINDQDFIDNQSINALLKRVLKSKQLIWMRGLIDA